MAQIFRVYKSEIPILVRVYGNHGYHRRYQSNYYEVLGVPSNATQKEIRDAFIKLSKKMHPDCNGKGSHVDFVTINEAYMVLSKAGKRQEYDINLKCNNIYNTNSFRQNEYYQSKSNNFGRYGFRDWEYQEENVQKHWQDCQYTARSFAVCLALMFVGVFVHIILTRNFKIIKLQKDAEFQQAYNKTKENTEGKTREEQIQCIIELSKKYGFDSYNDWLATIFINVI